MCYETHQCFKLVKDLPNCLAENCNLSRPDGLERAIFSSCNNGQAFNQYIKSFGVMEGICPVWQIPVWQISCNAQFGKKNCQTGHVRYQPGLSIPIQYQYPYGNTLGFLAIPIPSCSAIPIPILKHQKWQYQYSKVVLVLVLVLTTLVRVTRENSPKWQFIHRFGIRHFGQI